MTYSAWTFWFLAGGLATVAVGVLLAPGPPGEWRGAAEDVQDGMARAADEALG